jgi:F0F1-type ATP synthase membrane subunit a
MHSVMAVTVSPLAPETLFNVGPLAITNSMFTGVLTALLVTAMFLTAAKMSRLRPKSRFAFWVENLVELVLGLIVESFGDKKQARRFFPLLITLFVEAG